MARPRAHLAASLGPAALQYWRAGRLSTAYGLTLGYLGHLLIDQFSNELEHPLTYSLLYRASRRFDGPFFKPNDARAWRRESPRRLWTWL